MVSNETEPSRSSDGLDHICRMGGLFHVAFTSLHKTSSMEEYLEDRRLLEAFH